MKPEFPAFANWENAQLVDDQYQRYLADPASVDPSWRHFFAGVDFGTFVKAAFENQADEAGPIRRLGHLAAAVNPLEPPPAVPEGDFPLKAVYMGRIGFEYMDLGNPELETWIQQRIEPQLVIDPTVEEKKFLLNMLGKAELFEAFMHTRYVGQTRFSLEGSETLIPLLGALLQKGEELGLKDCTIGASHRGRLNLLANILNKPYAAIFQEFEDDTSLAVKGHDDVRYHMGFTGRYGGVTVSMTPNPSHLESVDPVCLGQTRAKQDLNGERSRYGAILIHGEAALSGQGVVYETLQMMRLKNYSVGGTIHVVVNNQIGFTTLPEEERSTRYSTDIAKAFGAPVFHVSGEDPEACLFVAKMAAEIRSQFQCDVFIDLLCYRKHGHNEGDEPSYTQPLQYKTIALKKTVRKLYAEKLLSEGLTDPEFETQFKETLKTALAQGQAPAKPPPTAPAQDPSSKVPAAALKRVLDTFCTVPPSFHIHPKLQKWLQERKTSPRVDWSTAECLAFGTLLNDGVPIRLAGEDTQRGTFSQRHLIWTDYETGKPYNPLSSIKTRFDVVNSPLSEFAGLGFEYGYSSAWPQAFVLWEAQYGDFFNGAQIIIDQYIASAEQKWNIASSITLLLPHAYEGAGPEHSSARMERFLQMTADNNLQIAYPSTPAQYFHLLRRQALRSTKKPLIVFTPKGLLRAAACTSEWSSLSTGRFEEILTEDKKDKLILCTGKVYYDLVAARKRNDVAIARIEQLYPLHIEKLNALLAQYRGQVIWVQEEPQNMGAWNYIKEFLDKAKYVGRPPNATPATGSQKKHKQEQRELLDEAFGTL